MPIRSWPRYVAHCLAREREWSVLQAANPGRRSESPPRWHGEPHPSNAAIAGAVDEVTRDGSGVTVIPGLPFYSKAPFYCPVNQLH